MKYQPVIDEKCLLRVSDLQTVVSGEDGWPVVDLGEYIPEIKVEYKKLDMLAYVGNKIFVRSELLPMLRMAYRRLQVVRPGYTFWVCYGYRHPDVQKRYFEDRYEAHKSQASFLTEDELIELTHTQVAYPEVAGHPTGGAIDVTIIDDEGNELDMGTGIADYANPEKCFVFSDSLTIEQKANRQLLRFLMMNVGFAPFNGEWWHFSYGDREWAYFYGRKVSFYGQIDYRHEF